MALLPDNSFEPFKPTDSFCRELEGATTFTVTRTDGRAIVAYHHPGDTFAIGTLQSMIADANWDGDAPAAGPSVTRWALLARSHCGLLPHRHGSEPAVAVGLVAVGDGEELLRSFVLSGRLAVADLDAVDERIGVTSAAVPVKKDFVGDVEQFARDDRFHNRDVEIARQRSGSRRA